MLATICITRIFNHHLVLAWVQLVATADNTTNVLVLIDEALVGAGNTKDETSTAKKTVVIKDAA